MAARLGAVLQELHVFRARWLLAGVLLGSCSAEADPGPNGPAPPADAPAATATLDCRVAEPDSWRELSDKKLVEAAIEFMAARVYTTRTYEPIEPIMQGLSINQRAVYSVAIILPAIEAGGFERLFNSRAGVLAPEAVAGLDRMDLKGLADAVEAAFSFAKLDPYPRELAERSDRVHALNASADQWDEINLVFDKACYDPDAKTRVYGSAVYKWAAAYIREHPSEFFLP